MHTTTLQRFVMTTMAVIAIFFGISILLSGHIFSNNSSFHDTFKLFPLWKNILFSMLLLCSITIVWWLSTKKESSVRFIFWCIIIFLVVGAIFFQPYKPVFDNFAVNLQAFHLVKDFPKCSWHQYFSIFPNNVAITNLLFWLDTPFKGIINTPEDLFFINACIGQGLMLFSIYQSMRLLDLIFDKKFGNVLLFFYILSPTYLMQFTQVAYSDTYSLPFLVASFRYVTQLLITVEDVNFKIFIKHLKNWYFIICSGLFMSLALYLRPNSIIALVAIIILSLLLMTKNRRTILLFLVSLVFFSEIITFTSNKTLAQTNYETNISKNNKMPIDSWFLTAYYNGGRSGAKINQITDKYKDYDKRKSYIRSKLFTKLRSLGPIGIIATWKNKCNVLFGIKSDFGMQYFNSFRDWDSRQLKIRYKNLYDFLTPKMIQISLIPVFTCICLLFFYAILFLKNKANITIYTQPKKMIFVLILGVFESLSLFYILLWEVQEHYVYMMLPFLLLIGSILSGYLAQKSIHILKHLSLRKQNFKH